MGSLQTYIPERAPYTGKGQSPILAAHPHNFLSVKPLALPLMTISILRLTAKLHAINSSKRATSVIFAQNQ